MRMRRSVHLLNGSRKVGDVLPFPPVQTWHCLFLGHGVNVENKWFPPLADPAVWRLFVDDTTDTSGAPSGRNQRDEWQVDELRGDKSMADVAIGLFKKYGLPHPWCSALISTLLSNAYQKRMSMAQRLPEYLLSGRIGKKGTSDALEVIINNHFYIIAD